MSFLDLLVREGSYLPSEILLAISTALASGVAYVYVPKSLQKKTIYITQQIFLTWSLPLSRQLIKRFSLYQSYIVLNMEKSTLNNFFIKSTFSFWCHITAFWYHIIAYKQIIMIVAQLARTIEYSLTEGWDTHHHHHNECPIYDTKQFDGETPVLELWGMWSTSWLPSFPQSNLIRSGSSW